MRRSVTILLGMLIGLANAQAQTERYENLVFEGAGMRGIAYAGVIRQLEAHGIIEEIQRVGGTSAGAITALMVSLGYDADEIYTIISKTKFQKFNDGRYIFLGGFSRLNRRYGWYRGEEFLAWIGNIIAAKTGNPDITLAELRAAGYKELHVTGASLNRQRLLVFSAESYPHMRVKDAVRVSMSIPLYYEAVLIDSLGGVHRQQAPDGAYDLVVDGGITGNYPIFLFDTLTTDTLGQTVRHPNQRTIGVRIDTETQIGRDSLDHALAPLPIENLRDYMQAFYVMVFENLNRAPLIPADWERTISVSARGVSPRIRRMSARQLRSLTDSGEESTLHWLRRSP